MTALVIVETILLVLLTLLVAGLLRSHAEILRRLEAGPDGGSRDQGAEAVAGAAAAGDLAVGGLPPARDEDTPAFDLAGTTLDGDAVKVSVAGTGTDTLLAFLSSGCLSCGAFWEGLRPGRRPRVPGDARIVVVTKDSAHESPSRLRELAPPEVVLVMSSQAWDAYRVKGSPYFIHVDGRWGRIRGEGTASDWPQVLSLLRDAFDDAAVATRKAGAAANGSAPPPLDRATLDAMPERIRRADRDLRAAGLYPGHPSLYGLPDEHGPEEGHGRA
jgi:hypothetical protein